MSFDLKKIILFISFLPALLIVVAPVALYAQQGGSGYNWSTGQFPPQATNPVQVTGTSTTPLDETTCKDEKGVYCLLEPLPIGNTGEFLTEITPSDSFGHYINIIIKILIGVVGVMAVISIVLGGVQYMTTDAFSRKEGGKEMITHAVSGLGIALVSVLLLSTINPQLTAIVFDVQGVRYTSQEGWQDGTTVASAGSENANSQALSALRYRNGMRDPGSFCAKGVITPNTQDVTDALATATASKNAGNFKDLTTLGVPVQATGKFAYKTLADNLKKLKDAAPADFTVTEAWQPSHQHCAKCHPLGTCVDVDFTNSGPADTIIVKDFIQKAHDAGLIAQFEVGTKARYDALNINDGSVFIWPGITAEHFSVYDRQ
jgi:hypothetical protein